MRKGVGMGFLNRLYHFVFGFFLLRSEEHQRARLLNLFLKEKIMAYPCADGFLIAARYRAKAERALATQGIEVSVGKTQGFPTFLRQHRSRVGILVGILLAGVLLYLASGTVWRVEVSGNENISEKEIEYDLKEIGFGIGSSIRKSDFVALCDALRLRHAEIAHADIYCVGTVAHVRIREAENPPKDAQKEGVAHLVSTSDAIVTSFDVKHGTVAVKEGQVVKRGELLVSGVVNGVHGDTLLCAEGKVYGRVSEEITVEIPYLQVKQSAVNTQNLNFTLFFFGKPINIQKNAGNLPPTYGTIIEEEKWTLWGGIPLPFSFLTEKAVTYRAEEVRLDTSEALRLGFATLKGKIEAKLSDGYLVSKSTTAEATDEGCLIKCTLTYVTCISESKPFFTE